MSGIKQDLLHAVRLLRKSPGFAWAAVLTLALGIGANLTVFLILYGVILRPLPFPDADRLVRLYRSYPTGSENPVYGGTEFLFLQRTTTSFASMTAFDYLPSNVNLVKGAGAVPLKALRATADFFRVFEMEPKMGRGFGKSDMAPNAPGVAVLSDALWRERFGADPQILGRSIVLSSKSYTIVGVADPKFRLEARVDVWVPLQIAEDAGDRSNQYNIVCRLPAHVTYAQASSDIKRGLLLLKETYPAIWNQDESIHLISFHDSVVGDVRPALAILMGAVGLVLLIVAANILSLLLTRAIARRREMSVRVALGASWWHILQLQLIENAVLATAGGLGGVLLAKLITPALLRLSPLALPDFSALDFGLPVVLFALALMFSCTLLFSIVPAIETVRTRLNEQLRVNTTQIASGRNLTQEALVVSEVAISLVLLVGAVLLLTSFWKLSHTPRGFATDDVLTFKTSFANDQVTHSDQLAQRVDGILSRIQALPGVESAATASDLPTQLVADLPFDIVERADRKDAKGDEKYIPISSQYFQTLGIPIHTGRGFSAGDSHGAPPVIVINEQFVRTYFKDQNPIGQHIRIGAMLGSGFEDPAREIVGVVGDVKQRGLDSPAPAVMYLPAAQIPDRVTQMSNGLLGTSWMVRMKHPGLNLVEQIHRVLIEGADAPLLNVEPLSEVVNASLAQQHFNMILLSGFGLISLILGAAGLYGVMSYSVARQTKEIGVRIALGANPNTVLFMILRNAGRLTVIGVAVGVSLSLLGAELMRSLVYGIAPRSPVPLLVASGLLMLTGIVSAWLPARRASTIEPTLALRSE